MRVRDGPAAVRGDAPAPNATGRRAGKAAREGAPSQKTCRSPRNPNPSRKEDSCHGVSLHPRRRSWRRSLVVPAARGPARARPRRGQDADDLRRDRAAAVGQGERARRARLGQRGAASSTTTSRPRRSARTSTRSAATRPPARAGWVFKVNGVSPPVGADAGRAEGRRPRALVLGDLRADRRAADARPRAQAKRDCYRVARPGRHRQGDGGARGDGCTSTAAASVAAHRLGLRRQAPRARDARRSRAPSARTRCR